MERKRFKDKQESQDKFIERKIITGLIVSTEYLKNIRNIWNIQLLGSPTAKQLALWCIEYYDKYQKAPNRDIEGIFHEKEKSLTIDVTEDISDILAGLSEEYEAQENFNVAYLVDQTIKYFQERKATIYIDQLNAAIAEVNWDEFQRL
jgi:nitrogenase molybdenum-iron protein alpha/beta subunit